MYEPRFVYGYDIETLNDPDRGFHGLDPRASRITEIAVATDPSINGGGEVFDDPDEAVLLRDFGKFVTSLAPGLMTGWNNTFFDNPFIAHRAGVTNPWFRAPMRLAAQPALRPKYDPLPTAATRDNPHGGWTAEFDADGGHHASLDVSYAYRGFADEHGVKWGLKPVCEALGVPMVELDRTRLHTYTPEERRGYVLSDSTGTRQLALRLLGVDHLA